MTLHEKIAQARLLAERASSHRDFPYDPPWDVPALAEALAIAVSALEHECCCLGDEGPADVCSACLAIREIGKKMGVEG